MLLREEKTVRSKWKPELGTERSLFSARQCLFMSTNKNMFKNHLVKPEIRFGGGFSDLAFHEADCLLHHYCISLNYSKFTSLQVRFSLGSWFAFPMEWLRLDSQIMARFLLTYSACGSFTLLWGTTGVKCAGSKTRTGHRKNIGIAFPVPSELAR